MNRGTKLQQNLNEAKELVLGGINSAISCRKPKDALGALTGLRRGVEQLKEVDVPKPEREGFHKALDNLISAIDKNLRWLYWVYETGLTFLKRKSAKFLKLYAQSDEMLGVEKGWCLALSMYWLAACKNDVRGDFWTWIRTAEGKSKLRDMMGEQNNAWLGRKQNPKWRDDFYKALPKKMSISLKGSAFRDKLKKPLTYKDGGSLHVYMDTAASEGYEIVDMFMKKPGFHSIGCYDLSDLTGHELGCYIHSGKIEVFDPNIGVLLIEKEHRRAIIEFLNLGGFLSPGHKAAVGWQWYE